MKERFKKYLEREFRRIAPTADAMEYREEVLCNLMDKAQELKIKGITDDDMIYEMCIDDLGDFYLTLQDFEDKRTALKKQAKKAANSLIFAVTATLFVVLAYLIISFLTHAWAKTWLIFIVGCFIFIVSLSVIRIPKLKARKAKSILLKLYITADIIMLTVTVYLCLLMLTPLNLTWLAFLVMPIAITLGLVIVSAATESKLIYLDSSLFIMTATSLTYVILGILNVVKWGWGWLLPVAGAFIVFLLFAVKILSDKKQKAAVKKQDKPCEENEEYYTKWKDE